MSRFLLTQSLLGNWLYIYNAFEGYEDAAHADFLKSLNREPIEQTEAMLAGIQFENMVNASAEGAEAKDQCVNAIADIVRGGQKQVALYNSMTADGIEFLLYGKLDYLKVGVIYDIKFSKSYEAGKYTESIQHPFYFALCPEARQFEYLVSNGNDVFIERYMQSETPGIEKTITEFLSYLNYSGLANIYFEKWKALS